MLACAAGTEELLFAQEAFTEHLPVPDSVPDGGAGGGAGLGESQPEKRRA